MYTRIPGSVRDDDKTTVYKPMSNRNADKILNYIENNQHELHNPLWQSILWTLVSVGSFALGFFLYVILSDI